MENQERFPADVWAAKLGITRLESSWPNRPDILRMLRQLEAQKGSPLSIDDALLELPGLLTQEEAQRLAVSCTIIYLSGVFRDYEAQR